ncbi:MAG: SusC/RagA family TonB-linked outer membrane protein [Prevotellaceae bacterium]|jgi:TonB-linked SusC/RagA family outer membrane protein|nr:SusC/RagA family TonB-linked outer membrane protein [Prevotellaceae bacterium]
MKKLSMMLAFLCIYTGLALAQTRTITGTVTSAEDGLPIIGATVMIPGTSTGTATNVDGQFSIAVPSGATTLSFSFVGMVPQELPIRATRNVVMQPDAQLLDEVVVTALGISRSEKTLGYAAQTVKADEISAGKSGSVMAGLAGKVAGVNISSSGPAGTSQKVLIRGISSLNSNSPLYIVDGSPIDNSRSGNDATDFGNAANDVNAEDVESVTVLKGASATALYGSRAANGVIMITTKRAKNEKLTVSYDGTFTASSPLRFMQTQDMYGQGWGSWDAHENGSWGPRLDGRPHVWGSDYLETPMVKPFSYVKDNMANFFVTGLEMNNVFSVRYGTDKVGIYASYGNLNSNGILPNDGDLHSRHTFSLRANAKTDKFDFKMGMNYVRRDYRRTEGMEMEMLQHAVDVDIASMKDYNDERYNLDNYYTPYATNPYWMIDNNYYKNQVDRIYGNMDLTYEIIPGLKATGRLSGDFTNSRTKNVNAKSTFTPNSYSADNGATEALGYYSNGRGYIHQIDAMAFLSADYTVGDFSLSGQAGWNLNQRGSSSVSSAVNGLDIPGWYNLLNTTSAAVPSESDSKRRLIGLFGQAEVGYKSYAYLTLSARNDWSSTLPQGLNSYFYAGANLSILLNEIFPSLKEHHVDFLKVRLAWGQTGSDASTYLTSTTYRPFSVGYTVLPLGGASGLTEYNVLPNTSLRPEMTTETEFGLTGNFFSNRLSVDVAYYHRRTKDQIISASMAPETGYTSGTRNVGVLQNQGIELLASVTPVRTRDWEWEVGVSFSKNWSKVVELWDDVTEYNLRNFRGVYQTMKVGEPISVLRLYDANKVLDTTSPYYGYYIVNNNGYYVVSGTEMKTIGPTQPDFIAGVTTSLKYKNFRLYVVGDWHAGGWMTSNTAYITHFNGNATPTLYNERRSFIFPHSVKQVNGEYVENNIPVAETNMYAVLGNYSTNPTIREQFTLPRDYFKIREITLTYDMPRSLIAKLPVSKLSLSLIGRNLFMWTPKANNYVDPEVSNRGNDLASELGESTSTLSMRNIGASIKVEF